MTEAGIDWMRVPFHKSSFSDTTGGECVEVGTRAGVVGIRDSKNPAGGLLALPAGTWELFADRVKTGT
jgi:uncharacterized protein DUF397